MKNGFTLIELLAVIVILAIIAVIAVPIILNIIDNTQEKANIESAKLYLSAVNLSLEKESINKEVNPTTCKVQTDGKLDCVGISEPITVEVDNPATGGKLTFEKGRIIKAEGLIINKKGYDFDDGEFTILPIYTVKFQTNNGVDIPEQQVVKGYVAQTPEETLTKEGYTFQEWRLNGKPYDFNTPVTSDITIKAGWLSPEVYTLATGQTFNSKLKTLAKGSAASYGSTDEIIKTISFYANGDLPDGYTLEKLEALSTNGTPKDLTSDNSRTILAYWDGNGNIYIYSDGQIYANSNSSNMFSYMKGVTYIDLTGLNTTNVTNMSYMFGYCIKLDTIKLSSSFDTSNVRNMSSMFTTCSALKNIDLTYFNTSNVTTMYGMFYKAGTPKTVLDFSSFNTSKVESMEEMFERSTMTSVDLSSFDLQSVTTMAKMFLESGQFDTIIFPRTAAPNLKSTQQMFMRCYKLKNLSLPIYNTVSLKNMSNMFYECSVLNPLDLSGFNTENVTSMAYMFRSCNQLTNLDLSGFETPNLTNMTQMFNGCKLLTNIDLRSSELSGVTTYTGMFDNVPKTATIYLKDTQTNRDFMSTNFSSRNVTYITPPEEEVEE